MNINYGEILSNCCGYCVTVCGGYEEFTGQCIDLY